MMMKHFLLFLALLAQLGPVTAQITDVSLTFTPAGGGTAVVVRATDSDNGLVTSGEIQLIESTIYTLTIHLDDAHDQYIALKDEIQFFFATSPLLFVGKPKYNDVDNNGLPVGFSTEWNTDCANTTVSDSFRVVLNNLGAGKSAASTISDGSTEFDLRWKISVINDPEAPFCENEEEIITDVVLTFTPLLGGEPVVARAQDPDGEGVLGLEILDDIDLNANISYELTIELSNSITGDDITEEVRKEGGEHMIFFEWTSGLFSDPAGNGNTDQRSDPVNYIDFDANNQPVGLVTHWTPGSALSTGSFRIVLKHQPGSKSASSTITDGDTDLDLSWTLNTLVTSVEEPAAGKASTLLISPNPAGSILQWELQGKPLPVVELGIFDPTGRLIHSVKEPGTQIDIGHLPAGWYILQLRNRTGSQSARFFKMP